jgi:predicted nucleic acid-binding protein
VNVVDASVLVDVITGALPPSALGDEDLAVLHLTDTEVLHAIRRRYIQRTLNRQSAEAAVQTFLKLSLNRWPADWLGNRVWVLRDNLTAYDASYVALTEMLGATALLTRDQRLASAPGINCQVIVL